MGKHGKNPKVWTTVLGLASLVLILVAVVLFIAIDPQWGTYPDCRYTARNVTVTVNPFRDCRAVMRSVVDDSDFKWTYVKQVQGNEFARLGRGQDSIHIYESGNKPLAIALVGHFRAAQWTIEVPSPSP